MQTVAGTGACHIGAVFLRRCASEIKKPAVYVGIPTWPNYEPLVTFAGLDVTKYRHLDPLTKKTDFAALLETVASAPEGSIFILQGCCHNPTGAGFTKDQWKTLAAEMKKKNHIPFFDFAYQGLGQGMNEDAWGVRYFADQGFEMIVAQSFSKNFALYGERLGALHVVSPDNAQENVPKIVDQLRMLIRVEISSTPAYASRLVNIVLADGNLRKEWLDELDSMRARLHGLRQRLYYLLTSELKTPGNWDNIVEEEGLFRCVII